MTARPAKRLHSATGLVRASTLDHFVIVVRDLPKSKALFERLGFHTTERGDHEGWGTANHLAVLERQYLELWGEHGEGPDAPLVRDLAARHEGLWQVGLKTPDADRLHANLTASGVPMDAPYDYARPIVLDGTRRSVDFRIAYVGTSVRLPLRMFLCEQRTPELIWRPEWQRHANGAKAVRELVLASRNPWDEANSVARFLDADLESATASEAVLRLVDGRIRFCHQPDANIDSSPDLPGLKLVVQVESLAATAASLQRGSIPTTASLDRIRIAPAHACGIGLDFVQDYTMGER